jgi:hypothetical protein
MNAPFISRLSKPYHHFAAGPAVGAAAKVAANHRIRWVGELIGAAKIVFADRRRAMTKNEIGAADISEPADAVAWRHFWLANVVVETDGRPLARAPRPELRPRKDSLSRRLQRLRHMRAILGAPQH